MQVRDGKNRRVNDFPIDIIELFPIRSLLERKLA